MEPLTALGLAANLVQFVQFAFDLSRRSATIYHSATGSSESAQHLDGIYSKLSTFSGHLVLNSVNNAPSHPGALASKHCANLVALAEDCQSVCDELLKSVGKLRVQEGTGTCERRWKSFRKALLETWQAGRVNELMDRIDRLQSNMTLHLCWVSSENIGNLKKDIRKMRDDAQTQLQSRTQEITDVAVTLRRIESQVENLSAQQKLRHVVRASDDDIDLLTTTLSSLSIRARRVRREQAIIKSLDYDQRPYRQKAISAAHKKTFSWIFKEAQPGAKPQGDFNHWLLHEHGTFWITGKPGSGKSTLLKYVAQQQKTEEQLRKWAHPKPVVIATHYFWSGGSEMQRSQEGLLRSFLHNIFCQAPSIIAQVCDFGDSSSLQELQTRPWSIDELQACLDAILDTDDLPFAICLFVDGLDESSDDHFEVCEALKRLCRPHAIKLCVSSRPWNVFELHFGKDPSSHLSVHELTRADIKAYSESRLHGHPGWKTLAAQTCDADRLINIITEKALGVFLWVFLVTNQLREGITEGDSIEDLHARLESFPADLEPFFKHMLDSVDEFYHKKMAELLLMMLAAAQNSTLSEMHPILLVMQEREYGNDGYAIQQSIDPKDPAWFERQIQVTKKRLNGRCKGLVEVNHGCVTFLHRTVKDFLETKPILDFLMTKSRLDFNPDLSIARAFLCWLKQTENGDIFNDTSRNWRFRCNNDSFMGLLNMAMSHAGHCEDLQSQLEPLLDNMEATINKNFHCDQRASNSGERQPVAIFRERVIYFGLNHYLSKNLSADPEYLYDCRTPPLSVPFIDISVSTSAEHTELLPSARKRRKATLMCLLQHGSHPNESYFDDGRPSTPWCDFIRPLSPLSSMKGRWGTMQLLLEAGADPDIWCGQEPYHVPLWLQLLFMSLAVPESPWDKRAEAERIVDIFRIMLQKSRTLDCVQVPLCSYATPWERLGRSISDAIRDNLEHPNFHSRMFREFAYYTRHLKLPWGELESKLERLVGPKLLVPILRAANDTGVSTPIGAAKRKAEAIVPGTEGDSQNNQACINVEDTENARHNKKRAITPLTGFRGEI
ncbi:hypothetical protein NPX13_g859 [Xylaria arbuscula]|uniref:NACHT domain-containing protein n=1 Tax=Xylaria arbuscula TaxID=114810 RepID=A0A9W8NN48_9PEZI|nr:hypothetical protein NPX13_g859 [Xylaria arbuscula]